MLFMLHLDMRPKETGLTNEGIERIVNFDWDVSTDEESGDEMEDISTDLVNNLERIVKTEEDAEMDIFENMKADNFERKPTILADNCFEKVDVKTLRWRKKPFIAPNSAWKEDDALNVNVVMKPVEYFFLFFDDQVIDLIRNQTELYGLQKHNMHLKCTEEDIKRYIGVLLYFGVLKLPQFKMGWAKELKLTAITNAMTRQRFEKLKQCLHFNNAEQPKKGDINYDKLHKIRPLLNILKENFSKLPQEEHQSVDEQIIAFKGRSSYKQYLPAKPHKWGLKMFTRAGISGLVYDFTMYVGEGTCPSYGLGLSSDVVLYLAKGLPKDKNFKLYFDNWFTSVSLLISLKEMGIFATRTVRRNRIRNCELLSDAELKKRGRGSYDMKCEINNNIICVKWFDNKSVQLISSCEDYQPTGICKRWSPKDKTYIDVERPAIVASYNRGMGGVDLADMLMELYKINHRSKKWYIRIFYWCLGTSVTNAWLLYRKHFKKINPNQRHISLLKFQMEIAHDLLQCTALLSKKRGRPSNVEKESSIVSIDSTPSSSPLQSKKYTFQPNPPNLLRYDKQEHWVVFGQKGRCRFCKTGTPMSKCIKCKIHLCCNTNKNCFLSYHT